jgi:hypothetical protein
LLNLDSSLHGLIVGKDNEQRQIIICYAVYRLNMEGNDEVVELDSLFIHQLWTPQPYFQHSKVRSIIFSRFGYMSSVVVRAPL